MQQDRWYDDEPIVSEAISAWGTLPQSLQMRLANHINHLVDAQNEHRKLSGRFDKVGRLSAKQLHGLYMSGLKRRWHDKEPDMRKAAKSLVYVEREELINIAKCILKVHTYWQEAVQQHEHPDHVVPNGEHTDLGVINELITEFERKFR